MSLLLGNTFQVCLGVFSMKEEQCDKSCDQMSAGDLLDSFSC